MDITTKNIIELKALCFDQLVLLENTQKNIQLINAEISKKIKEETKPDEK